MCKQKFYAIFFNLLFLLTLCSPVFSLPAEAETLQPEDLPTVQFPADDFYAALSADSAVSEDSDFLFYDQLDENNQAVYTALSTLIENPADNPVTVSLPETLSMQVSSKTTSDWTEDETNAYSLMLIQAMRSGMVALSLDEPMLFWVSFSATKIAPVRASIAQNRVSKTYTLTVSSLSISLGCDENYESTDAIIEKRTELQQAITDFPITGSTNAEKCASIHDTLIEQITYDANATYCGSIAGALIEPYHAVCEGYSKAFKVLCDREKIPCILVVGNNDLENMTAHMWNYVQLDGLWYAVDVTWDDSTSSNRFFLKGSETFSLDHTPESVYPEVTLTFPSLSEQDYGASAVTTTSTTETTTTETTTTTTTSTTSTTTETTTTTTASTTSTTTETTTTTTASTTSTTTETTTTTTASTTSTTTEITTTTTASTTSTTTETTTTVSTTSTTTETTTTTTKPTTSTTTETTTSTTTRTYYPNGDSNQDGVCTLTDYVLLRKYLIRVAGVIGTPEMDVNADGRVDVLDAIVWARQFLQQT